MNGPHLHRCAVPGCGGLVPTVCLMCRRHWRLVPEKLQGEFWSAQEARNCGDLSDADLDAVKEHCTQAVAARTMAQVARAERGGGM